MLQAESTCARDWRVPNLPETPPVGTIARKTVCVYKTNNKRKIYIKSAFMVFGYSLLLVFLCIKSATLGYQIENLEQDIQGLETANHRLEFQIAEKSSLDRVERIAVTQLGMTKPDAKSSLAMEVKSEPIQVASVSPVTTDDQNISEKLLNKMFSSLSRLAQNNN